MKTIIYFILNFFGDIKLLDIHIDTLEEIHHKWTTYCCDLE